MNAGYKNFMTEVNNLNKRMGDLRDTNGDAGALGAHHEWCRFCRRWLQ